MEARTGLSAEISPSQATDVTASGPATLPPIDPLVTAPFSPGTFWRLLQCFGPAAVAASVSIGAGETILVVRAGAWSGYQLLWLMALSCFLKGALLTYLLGRYTVISGEPMAQRLAMLPGPRGWFLWTVLSLELVTAPLYWTAIAKPCGVLLAYLCLPAAWADPTVVWLLRNVVTSSLVLAAIGIGFRLTYQNLEREQVWICGLLVLGTMAGTTLVFWQRPEFGPMLLGWIPRPFEPAAWASDDVKRNPWLTLATIFAYVGNTTLGYVVYANWVGMHRWGMTAHPEIESLCRRARQQGRVDYLPTDPADVTKLRQTTRLLKWDAGVGAVVLLAVSASFLASGAAVLYRQQSEEFAAGRPVSSFDGWSLLTDQAAVWNVIHPALVWVYYGVIFIALWGTLQSFPEIYVRVLESFHAALRPDRPAPIATFQRWIGAWLAVACLLLIWTDAKFDLLTQLVGLLTNGAGVALMMLAGLYLDRTLPAALRTHPVLFWTATAGALLLIGLTAISANGLFR